MEKILNDHETIKTFSCDCREWSIKKGDSPHAPNDIDKVFTVYHGPKFKTCPKLDVYQEKKGMKRYFVKKVEILSENNK